MERKNQFSVEGRSGEVVFGDVYIDEGISGDGDGGESVEEISRRIVGETDVRGSGGETFITFL